MAKSITMIAGRSFLAVARPFGPEPHSAGHRSGDSCSNKGVLARSWAQEAAYPGEMPGKRQKMIAG
jgi:hypothetical protein